MANKTLLLRADDEVELPGGIRMKEIKKYFWVIGSLSISLVILLFVLFQIGVYYYQIDNVSDLSLNREKRSVNSFESENIDEIQSFWSEISERRRRNIDIDQNDWRTVENEIKRRKRLITDMQDIEAKFEKCKQIQNDQRCEHFLREMAQINKLLQENMVLMEEVRRKYDRIEQNKMQPVVHTRPVPIHEDLDRANNLWNNDKTKFLDALHNEQKHVPQPTSGLREFREKNDDKAITPLKNTNFDPTGQILQVCDQINRQSSHSESSPVVSNLPGPTSSGFVQTHTSQTSSNFGSTNVQPHAGPTSIGFVPNTVQSHVLNPSPNNFPIQSQAINQPQISYRSSPLCFFPQVQQQMPIVQSVFVPQPFVNTVPAATVPQPGRMMFVTGGGQFAATSPSGQGFIPLNANQPSRARESLDESQPQCPFATPEKQQQQQQQQQSHQQQQQQQLSHQQKQLFSIEPESRYAKSPKNVPQDSDIIYATFASQHGSLNLTNPFNQCQAGETSCIGSIQCIPNEKWCDNVVDCVDSSDETACSCTSRISEDKICDGYLDCPLGADEIGCFNCDKFSYSCFNSREEYQRSQHMRVSMCYAITEKCDGVHNCLNGKDEEDCSMLVGSLGLQTSYMVPYTDGILHRNYRGRWYPVCENPNAWAKEACEAEIGFSDLEPKISMSISVLPGPFISIASDPRDLSQQIRIHESCRFGPHNDRLMVRVRCPDMKCGTTAKKLTFILPKLIIRDDINRQKREEDFVRIVGGDRSIPHSWPFIVALYRDGSFHCGGTIINTNWILSAAHCMTRASNHYYEVHAGLLRRYSHAPEVQISVVTEVIVNSGYTRIEMANDLSLLRLRTPLQFNRWVRPICLPSPERITLQHDEKWMFGPAAGSVCTAVGWGSIRERGPSPDNLKEVNVPIMKACKHLEDITGNEICAGEKDGGRDACQGDSGGPLFCQSVSNPEEHYIAGIVSHGEGCARRDEPGVYTRVALYIDWINEMENSDLERTAVSTKTICPGYTCAWNNRCISFLDKCNQIVDCLAGDDELECPFQPELVGATQAKTRKGRQDTTPEAIEPEEIEADDTNKSNVDSSGKKLPVEKKIKTNFPTTTQQSPKTLDISSTEPRMTTTEHQSTAAEETTTEMRRTTTSPLGSTTPKAEILSSTTTTTSKPHHTTHLKPTKPAKKPIDLTFATTDKSLSPTEDQENFGPPKKHSDRNTTIENPLHEVIKPDDIFLCTKLNQSINIEFRCDGVDDCTDASDENCTCRDVLHRKQADLICDGHVDCLDLSDEKNCLICSDDEYGCRLTKKCISKASQCDSRVDCQKGEDELDCYALTDGQNIVLDADLRPELNHKGIVSHNTNGLWAPMCVHRMQIKQNEKTASETCSTLGFIGSSYHNVTEVTKVGIKSKPHRHPSKDKNKIHHPINKHLLSDQFSLSLPRLKREMGKSDDSGLTEIMLETPITCWGLYVECIPHSVRPIIESKPDEQPNSSEASNGKPKPEIHNKIEPIIQTHAVPNAVIPPKIIKNETTQNEVQVHERNFYAPWSASVYINGYLKCLGVLIDRFWVLTETSCVAEIDWEQSVIYVLFGRLKNVENIKRKDEQIIRVDCTMTFNGTNVTLLHLVNGVQYRRQTLPTFLPDSPNIEDDDCVAVSYDRSGDLVSIPVRRIAENNTNTFSSLGSLKRLKCSESGSYSKYGTIVCRADNSSYYPVSLFERKNGLCEFENATNFELLDESYPKISKIANWQFCNYAKEEPVCDGFRCPLGKCIALGLLCDGNPDCGDNSDEEPLKCIEILKRCRKGEFKCSNGDCIPKSKFCDTVHDCNDNSDEPMNCTCLNYLKITNPSKICDGIPTCADKSDEIGCACQSDSFHCKSQSACIPNAFVCDGTPDCPNGEDEAFCYALEQPTDISNKYYRVAERSSGAWETKCIAKERATKLNKTELKNICKQLGFDDVENVLHRLIDPIGNVTHIERNYPRRAVKISTRIPSSTVKLNDNFNVTLIPSSRSARPIEWNQHDENSCFQLEIICDE